MQSYDAIAHQWHPPNLEPCVGRLCGLHGRSCRTPAAVPRIYRKHASVLRVANRVLRDVLRAWLERFRVRPHRVYLPVLCCLRVSIRLSNV